MVPLERIAPDVPQNDERYVLREHYQVVGQVLVSGGLILDVKEAEQVDGTDDHVEEILPTGPRLTRLAIAEAGLLVHEPDGHNAPVTDSHRTHPVAEFTDEQTHRQNS